MAELRFECQVCRSALSADESQVGALVRCPLCKATLRVPRPQAVGAGAGSSSSYDMPPAPPLQRSAAIPSHLMGGGRAGPGKRYGFNCVYCSSRLEATESMAAQEGQCPTCGNNITFEMIFGWGGFCAAITPHLSPVAPHAGPAPAAAGARAPRIIRRSDGAQTIECPRCQSMSPITANNCKSCGMPFTMEGTTLEAAGTSNGFCVASLVLGIIGLPTSCLVIPSLLAIVFGIIGYNQVAESGTESPGKGMAIAGVICGAIGAVLALYIHVLS
jgi:hypothetical protein